MSGTRLRILLVGGQAEDVRAVDAGARDLGLSVDWIEPADAPAYLDAPDILAVVLDLDNTGLAVAPDQGCTASYPVRVENGVVWLSLTPVENAKTCD